jgi:hypothetical protein
MKSKGYIGGQTFKSLSQAAKIACKNNILEVVLVLQTLFFCLYSLQVIVAEAGLKLSPLGGWGTCSISVLPPLATGGKT